MVDHFIELFGYNHNFNQEFAKVFLEYPEKTGERTKLLFCHLLNAHNTWNSRINVCPSDYDIWEEFPLRESIAFDNLNYKASLQILQERSLESLIPYKNSKGEAFTSSIQDILFHIINHSTYHRGQINMFFRQNGIEPIVSDYIFYKRRS